MHRWIYDTEHDSSLHDSLLVSAHGAIIIGSLPANHAFHLCAAIINLLRDVHRQALEQGGAVYMLNGNHESLNICGDFRCVWNR
jgi:hypothetical protein